MNVTKQMALRRLKSAPWKSRTTQEALILVQQARCEGRRESAAGGGAE